MTTEELQQRIRDLERELAAAQMFAPAQRARTVEKVKPVGECDYGYWGLEVAE